MVLSIWTYLIAAVIEPLSQEHLQRISAAFLAALEAFRAKVPDDYYNQEEAGLRSAFLAAHMPHEFIIYYISIYFQVAVSPQCILYACELLDVQQGSLPSTWIRIWLAWWRERCRRSSLNRLGNSRVLCSSTRERLGQGIFSYQPASHLSE